MSIRLLALADLHLGASLPEWGPFGDARRADLRAALRAACALAVDPAHRIDAVLVAGDLFDRPDPPPDLVTFAGAELARVTAAGIPLVILPGDHDPATSPAAVYRAGVLPAETILVDWPAPGRIEVPLSGAVLHLYAFDRTPGRTPRHPFLAVSREDLPGFHVGLFHAEALRDGEPRRLPAALPLPDSTLERSNLDLAVVGRRHEFEERRVGRTTLVTPGTPVGLTWGEGGKRGFVVVEADDAGIRVERHPSAAPAVIEQAVKVVAGEDEAHVLAGLARAPKGGMVRIRLTGVVSRPLDAERIAMTLRERGVPADVVDDTVVDGSPAAGFPGGDPVLGAFARRMQERMAAAASDQDRLVLRLALHAGLTAAVEGEDRHAA